MDYTINTEKKFELFNDIYTDFAEVLCNKCYDIPNLYSIILYDRLDNKKKVLHIECEDDLNFFVKNFAYNDVIYIIKFPWRNSHNIDSRYDIDCINGIIYNEYLEEFNGNRFKYFNAICKEFGVENYGEENNPWQGRY